MNSPWQAADPAGAAYVADAPDFVDAEDGSPRRHGLVFLSGTAWSHLMRTRADLAAEPLVATWADRDWPLVVRRPDAGEATGLPGRPSLTLSVALGLPLPPAAGKRRLAFVVRPEDIVATAPPLALRDAFESAPLSWRCTLARIVNLAGHHDVEVRIFGSLAWQAITGLDYLSATSDLDLLIPLRPGLDATAFAVQLAAIEHAAPMRLDGEFVRSDGAAVNWRELHNGAAEVLVKTRIGSALMNTRRFAAQSVVS